MKIDFLGSYRDLKSILGSRAPAQRNNSEPTPFNKLLASVSPNPVQLPENSVKIPQERASIDRLSLTDTGPMASFNFPPPELKTPELIDLPETAEVGGTVNQPQPSVKTPTLVSARWIEHEQPLADLHKSQRMAVVNELVKKAGNEHGIDPALGMSVVASESAFNPNAVSADGFESKGLFQLLDTTGKDILKKLSLNFEYKPFDPEQNVTLGVGYLRYLHDIFSTSTPLPGELTTTPAANSASLEKLAVAAFNAGEGRVASAQARAAKDGLDPSNYSNIESYLPQSTQEYVSRVIRERDQFEERGSS